LTKSPSPRVRNPGKIAVIGGTGMNQWPGLEIRERLDIATPYGTPSAPLLLGRVYGIEAVFLARHGDGHKLPPHAINYRANLWALREAGVGTIVAIAAVGGIAPWLPPGAVAAPVDVIDYTWGREHTYSDGAHSELRHVEFTEPYSERVRRELLHAALSQRIDIVDGGILAVTQGPRLESAAEIRRLKRDGCDMVGMTGMPEAALARELDIDYACLAVGVNWAAGIGDGDIHGEIQASIEAGMEKVRAILGRALPVLRAADEEMR
jgi:5'-deoxy-5'-methylthioadenosine phosphorylase